MQVISSSTSKSQGTSKSYTIFHVVSSSSAYVIYLMECTLSKKQYVGKSETSFNIILNIRRNNVKKLDAISVYKHFQEWNQINLQIPPNQKTFCVSNWLKKKNFAFKCCKPYN